MARDIATARDALQDRLGNLTGLVAYDVATGNEQARLNNVVALIFPAPNPEGFWPSRAGDNCAIRLNFIIQLWVNIAGGIARAQETLDTFISAGGTHANSIEACLENPAGTYNGDELDLLVSSVEVGQFTTYVLGALNSETANSLTATIPVELLLPGA